MNRTQASPLATVISLLWNDPPHTATVVCRVVGVTGNQMNLQVKHRLPRDRPVIDADVVAMWAELFTQHKLGPVQSASSSERSSGSSSKKEPT